MGVTKLWNVLKNAKQDITLDDIKGKTLAVDLAAWICELESVKQTHYYLRNLFFRLSGVIKADIVLVFVLDGKPPELKWETISKRLASSSGELKKSSGVRSRLNAKLKECCILFDSLGVPWIKAEGEAEALCAALNKAGLVDGVVTSDGDAFLYGAQTVYRNFSIEKGVAIEKYCIENIEKSVHLDQRGLIALGLLLGCDYCPKGVLGVGEAQAVKLLSSFHGKDALSVFSSWRDAGCSTYSVSQTKPVHCSSCGHEGAKKDHFDSCCIQCGRNCADSVKHPMKKIPCQCDWHKGEVDRKKSAFEEKIRVLAIKDPRFPDENIIREFLKSQRYVSETRTVDIRQDVNLRNLFRLKPPKLDIACSYLEQKANWTILYSVEKVLPLLTHFLLSKPTTRATPSEVQIQLNSIIKKRVKDHVESLEVEWRLSHEIGLKFDGAVKLITVESEKNLSRLYPDTVKKFYEELQKEKEEKKAQARREQQKNKKLKTVCALAVSDESQNRKMTDYFKTKKLRNEDKKVDKQGEADVTKVESALSYLALTERGLRNEEKQSQILKDNKSDNTAVLCRKSETFGNSVCPVIVFSSDSEDEDFDIGNIVNQIGAMTIGETPNASASLVMKAIQPTTNSSMFQDVATDNKPSENDITFSNDLDFSLGCSLLQTPVSEDKENKCPSTLLGLSKVRTNLSPQHYEEKVVDTPGKTSCDYSEKTPYSPVFMTLMERLKARKKL